MCCIARDSSLTRRLGHCYCCQWQWHRHEGGHHWAGASQGGWGGNGDARKEGAAAREREESAERRNVKCPTSHHPSLSECVKLFGSDLRRAPPLRDCMCSTREEWGVLLRRTLRDTNQHSGHICGCLCVFSDSGHTHGHRPALGLGPLI